MMRPYNVRTIKPKFFCVSPAQPPRQSTPVSTEGSDTAASTSTNHVAITEAKAQKTTKSQG